MQAHLTDSYISRIKTPDARVELKDTRIPGFIVMEFAVRSQD